MLLCFANYFSIVFLRNTPQVVTERRSVVPSLNYLTILGKQDAVIQSVVCYLVWSIMVLLYAKQNTKTFNFEVLFSSPHFFLSPFVFVPLSFFTYSFFFRLSRVSSVGPSRKTSIHLTPVNMKAAASLTRSPATSASCAALRSAFLWAWPWTVS